MNLRWTRRQGGNRVDQSQEREKLDGALVERSTKAPREKVYDVQEWENAHQAEEWERGLSV